MIFRFYFWALLPLLIISSCSSKKQSGDSFSLPNFDIKKNTVAYSDFIGSNDCKQCHVNIYNEWKTSTHAQAGGVPTSDRVIAPFSGKPIELADAVIYPEKINDTFQFRIKHNSSSDQEIIHIEAVIGKGLLYGGGTQTFFGKYSDGTYRFLPFD